MKRREFLRTGSCGAYVLSLAAVSPWMTRKVFAAQEENNVVAAEKWGRIEKIQDGIWALISLPFETQDFTTVCNGGIISGSRRTLVVEAFMQDKGAEWMSERALKLTGRRPTDIVCTHYHADHTAGHAGFEHQQKRPRIWLTESTLAAARDSLNQRQAGSGDFQNVQKMPADKPTEIDLGDRVVRVHPRQGHTASDVTIEVVDPKVVFCGDLFFNRIFPNYSDAVPPQLANYARQLNAANDQLFVPGHGPVADAAALKAYQDFLNYVEDRARTAFQAGKSAAQGAQEFNLPDSMSDWLIWSPQQNAPLAFQAWYKVLAADQKKDGP